MPLNIIHHTPSEDELCDPPQITSAYKRSIKNALDVLKEIMNDKIDNYPEINIGINVEQLTKSNMPIGSNLTYMVGNETGYISSVRTGNFRVFVNVIVLIYPDTVI